MQKMSFTSYIGFYCSIWKRIELHKKEHAYWKRVIWDIDLLLCEFHNLLCLFSPRVGEKS